MATYACGDLHGRYDLWCKIKKYLTPDDELIFLGDAADRGHYGYKIMKELLDDPRVTYLRGNHEDMFIKAANEYLYENRETEARYLLMYNGGQKTLEDWINDNCNKEFLDKLNQKLILKIKTLKDGKTIWFTHSGNIANNKHAAIWDRDHISREIEKRYKENEFIIHGHTPTTHKKSWLLARDMINPQDAGTPKALHYCGGHKICIDTGAIASGIACLFNVNTFEEIYIKEDTNDIC